MSSESWVGKLWKAIVQDDRLDINDDAWTLKTGEETPWVVCGHSLLVRACYKDLKKELLTNRLHSVILQGKSGRGKSVFMLWLMFDVLLSAKRNRGNLRSEKSSEQQGPKLSSPPSSSSSSRKDPEDVVLNPKICYRGRDSRYYLLTLEFCVEVSGWIEGVHFWFSDNHDIYIPGAKVLNLAITSGDEEVLKEFRKRMKETSLYAIADGSGVERTSIMYLPAPTETEIGKMFPTLDEAEVAFKYAVIGGNLLAYSTPVHATDFTYYGVLSKTISWFFGDDFVPPLTSSGICPNTKEQTFGAWAVNLFVNALITRAHALDSGLFMDYDVSADYRTAREQFSTTFASILARNIRRDFEGPVLDTLKKLFGSGGLCRAFECDAHVNILDSSKDTQLWCLDADGQYKSLLLGGRRRVFIRDIEDVKSLEEGDYGLPLIPNFPLIDAVIPPNTVLQMTISKRHSGAIGKLNDIANALGTQVSELYMVYVVPATEVRQFKFDAEIESIQLVTTGEAVASLKAFKKLIGDTKSSYTREETKRKKMKA